MSHRPSPLNSRSIAWALLSQSIWTPLLVIDAHDHWQARVKALTPPTDPSTAAARPTPPPTRLAAASPLPSLTQDRVGVLQPSSGGASRPSQRSGLLLNGALPVLPTPSLPSLPALPALPTASLPAPAPLLGSLRRAVSTPFQAVLSLASPARWLPPTGPRRIEAAPAASRPAAWQGPPIPTAGGDLLMRSFTRSELLGGTLSLRDLDTAPMSAVALAERARWAGSVDPLAPLPALWRDPMRRALGQIPGSGPRVEQARLVHVPSRRVTRPTEVPLALQSDGSVDILSRPDDPGVVREIAEWSSHQQPPVRGGVLPAVVLLHPVQESAPLQPAQVIQAPILSESEPGPRPIRAVSSARLPSIPPWPGTQDTPAPSHAASEPAAAAKQAAAVDPAPAVVEAAPAPAVSAAPAPEPVVSAAAPEPVAADPVPPASPAPEPAAAP